MITFKRGKIVIMPRACGYMEKIPPLRLAVSAALDLNFYIIAVPL